MHYETVLTLDGADRFKSEPQQMLYEKIKLCRTKNGNWLYLGWQGPASRYISMQGMGDEPHAFIVPAEEAYRLLEYTGNYDLIVKYFPEIQQKSF